MTRAMRYAVAAAAAAALMWGGSIGIDQVLTAQTDAQETGYDGALYVWHVPFGLTPGQTARYNYSNFAPVGTPPITVEWAFSDALTGEQLRGNFGNPRPVPPMEGRIWTLKGEDISQPGMRREIVAWLRVNYPTRAAARRAVDISSVEIVDDETGKTVFTAEVNLISTFSAGGDSGSL